MRHGSLFSGIGGFDLAAEWMGWENVFHCEWNTFGQKVLHHYWPNAEQFTDITKSDFTKYANTIDILTGGFPCQPYSSAGKRLGKEDERHLWPEMLRAIREIQPRWVVGENVLGLVNWSGGLVFHEVQADLEAEGYEVQPYVLPAVSVNAPHRRDRVWFVAHSKSARTRNDIGGLRSVSERCDTWQENELPTPNSNHPRTDIGMRDQREWSQNDNEREGQPFSEYRQDGSYGDAADTDGERYTSFRESESIKRNWSENDGKSEQRGEQTERIDGLSGFQSNAADTCSSRLQTDNTMRKPERQVNSSRINGKDDAADTKNIRRKDALENGELEGRRFRESNQRNAWDSFPSVSPICTGDDGISDRLDSITFSKWRNESIKAGGNAIVPQVVYQIFKTIKHYENLHKV
jgi:DNA (cytosine-5)-methyltransferase 1